MKLNEFIGMTIQQIEPYHVQHAFGFKVNESLSLFIGNVDPRTVYDYQLITGYVLDNFVIGKHTIVVVLSHNGFAKQIHLSKWDKDKPFMMLAQVTVVKTESVDASEYMK